VQASHQAARNRDEADVIRPDIIVLQLEDEALARLEAFAKKSRLSRHEAARVLVRLGLDASTSGPTDRKGPVQYTLPGTR
jgi:hypothetical protein